MKLPTLPKPWGLIVISILLLEIIYVFRAHTDRFVHIWSDEVGGATPLVLSQDTQQSILRVLERITRGHDQTFVQIGAHVADTSNDPISKHMLNWTGCMMEPVPWNFNMLQSTLTRKNIGDKVQAFQSAFCSQDSSKPILYAMSSSVDPKTGHDSKSNKDLPFWVSQIASLDRNQVLKFKDTFEQAGLDITEYIEELEVQCMDFSDIVSKCNLDSVSVLFVDTEGFDADVILSPSFTMIKPLMIYLERQHLDRKKYERLLMYLHTLGYICHEVKTSNLELLAVHKSLFF